MPENTRAPIPKRRWLPALGVAVIAVAAGVGWFFLKEIRLFTAHAYNDEDWKEVVDLIGKGEF